MKQNEEINMQTNNSLSATDREAFTAALLSYKPVFGGNSDDLLRHMSAELGRLAAVAAEADSRTSRACGENHEAAKERDAAWGKYTAIEDSLCTIPATSLEGVAVKVKYIRNHTPEPGDDIRDKLILSLARDLGIY